MATDLLTPAWYTLKPHKQQALMWASNERFLAARAGRGSGKSTVLIRKLVTKLPEATWHGEPGMYCFCAPTRDQSKRIAWDKLKALIHPSWLAKEPSESELLIKTIWGSTVQILGFDKPHRIEGVQWDGIVVDESADIKPGSVDKSVIPALTVKQGFLWRLGVPKRQGIGAREWKKVCNDSEYKLYEWSAEDLLPASEITRLRNLLDPKDYEEQIQGKALEEGGAAFYAFSLEGNVDPTVKYDPTKHIVVGSDFNVDPMAWVLCQLHGDQLHVFDELFLPNTNTRRTLDTLWRRYATHKAGWVFIGDATSKARKTVATTATPSDYLAIKNDTRFADTKEGKKGCKVQYPKSNPPVKDRLASCNAMLCTYSGYRRVKIAPGCTNLIEDLESRDLDERGAPKDADKYGGHISDAFGYVIHKLFPIRVEIEDSNRNEISLTVVG